MKIKNVLYCAVVFLSLTDAAFGQATNGPYGAATPTWGSSVGMDFNGVMVPFTTSDGVTLNVSGGGGGGGNVNIDAVGGNPVTTTIPIECITGCGGSGGTASAFGATMPADGTAAGFADDNGNMAFGNLDASGNILVNVASGTITASSGADATAVPPTYSEGVTEPLSQDLSGNLRVYDLALDTAVQAVETALGSPMQNSGGTVGISGSLPAGNNNIGDVDLASSIPAGNNNIGDVDAVQSGAWSVGLSGAVPAGNNNIGDVDVASLPAIPAGNNNIGDVDAIQSGNWAVSLTGSLPAGTNNIGDVDVLSLPSIPAGNNNIGNVDVASITGTVDVENAGTFAVQCTSGCGGSGGTSSAFGGAFPIDGTAIGFFDGTDMSPGNLNGDGGIEVHVTNGGSGGTSSTYGDPMPSLGTAIGFEDASGNMTSLILNATGDAPVYLGEPIPAGTNNIGDIDIASAIPAGTNNIGDVDVASIAAGNNNIGDVDVASIIPGTGTTNLGKAEDAVAASGNVGVLSLAVQTATPADAAADGDFAWLQMKNGRLYTQSTFDGSLPAGTNNIGDVDIASAIPAGTNNIGDVDIASAIPAGANNIGSVNVATLPPIPAGTNNIGDVDVLTLPSTPAGNNNIGDVDVASLPAIPAGSNNIGDVDIASTDYSAPTGSAVPANASYIGAASDGGLTAGTPAVTGLITCKDSVAISTNTANNTQLVALTASESIYVCGYDFIADGDVDVQLIYGTGTACATGETDMTGAYPLAAQSGIVVQSPFSVMSAPASNALCIELSGATQVSGRLNYTKF